MRINTQTQNPLTHEGAKGAIITPEQLLRRLTMTCMLWEDTFYVDGKTISEQIQEAAEKCSAMAIMGTAVDCKKKAFLRHVSLYLLKILVSKANDPHLKQYPDLIKETICKVITRPDEMGELLALYWKDGKKPLSAQLKKALANCFHKFDEYQFAKWDKNHAIKLRDVMFMTHPKPKNDDQAELFKRIATRTLKTPETYETVKSKKEDQKENLESLLVRGKMGYTALLMNLKNMRESGVSEDILDSAIRNPPRNCKVLPYQFLKCYENNVHFGAALTEAMIKCSNYEDKIPGKTILLVDVSGSMEGSAGEKAESLALSLVLRCENPRLFVFGNRTKEIEAIPSFALSHLMRNSYVGTGTMLSSAINSVSDLNADRLIVITDEQSHESVKSKKIYKNNYMVNVAPYKVGVGYNTWTHIDGFSPYVADFIFEYEKSLEGEK